MTDPSAPPRDLASLGADVPWPDPDAERAVRERRLDRSPGRPDTPYGTLATAAEWLAGTQRRFPPTPPADVRLVVVTARHAAGGDGRSVDDAPTARAAVDAGELPVHVLAARAGIRVEVVDTGEVGAIDREDAASTAQILAAVELGAATADRLADEGADLLVVTEVGVGASTAAAAVVSVLTMGEPVLVAGRGSGLDDAGWAVKTAAIRDARRRGVVHRTDVTAVLAAVGGADIAFAVGLILRGAGRATPVLLDGPSAVAAGLVARDITPRITRWIRVASAGTDLAELVAVERMGLTPFARLDLSGVGVTAGVGGVLAVAQLVAAADLSQAPLSLAAPQPAAVPEPGPDPATEADPDVDSDPDPDPDVDVDSDPDPDSDVIPGAG